MENFIDLTSVNMISGVIIVLMATFVMVIITIMIVAFFSWLNFVFMPEIEGTGVVTHKSETSGSNEYAGGISMPAERFIYLELNEKSFSCLTSRKNFDLLKSGDKVKILYQKGFFGFIRVTKII